MFRFTSTMFSKSLHMNVLQGAWRTKGAQNADDEKSYEHDLLVKLVPFGDPAFYSIIDLETTRRITQEEGGPALAARTHNVPPTQ